jgi:uncharacterized protein YjbJ (UPF0337 family)
LKKQLQWEPFPRQAVASRNRRPEETIVDVEHVRAAADKAKGVFKDAVGKMIGDKQMEAEGKFEKAKGAVHQALGDVKEAVRRVGRH